MRPKTAPRERQIYGSQGHYSRATATEGGTQGRRSGVTTLPRGQGSAETIPGRPKVATAKANAARYPGWILGLKIFGGKKTGGVFSAGVSPGRKNGMNNILGLVSGPSIKHRGAYGTRLRLRVPGLWLTVPLLGA